MAAILAIGAIGAPLEPARSQAPPRRWVARVACLRHAGPGNDQPRPLADAELFLRDLSRVGIILDQKELALTDPELVRYPLAYLRGREAFALSEAERTALRRHLSPGGGTLFADAAGGSPAFDASFRRLVAAMFPDAPLVPIPPDDPIFRGESGYHIADVRRTEAAGGKSSPPRLEGIKVGDRWAVIYSDLDIGDSLQRRDSPDRRGYAREDAAKLFANAVVHATSP
ncbi:DUF4159 domain-containing protein [Tundrisphaera sp. TA3]|uniref:DUF4159 domain-containing protein n=1 Tax=Tundrisphaera sp. TA3 TaxID=3435775 RepID=UPI003EBA01DE